MGTRIFFFAIALGIVAAGGWAYHHDEELRKNAMQVALGDPNEVVRELLGDPSLGITRITVDARRGPEGPHYPCNPVINPGTV